MNPIAEYKITRVTNGRRGGVDAAGGVLDYNAWVRIENPARPENPRARTETAR